MRKEQLRIFNLTIEPNGDLSFSKIGRLFVSENIVIVDGHLRRLTRWQYTYNSVSDCVGFSENRSFDLGWFRDSHNVNYSDIDCWTSSSILPHGNKSKGIIVPYIIYNSFFEIKHGRSAPSDPSAFGGKRFAGSIRGISSGFGSLGAVNQAHAQENSTSDRSDESYYPNDERSKSPLRHILLSVQVIFGALIFALSIGFLKDAIDTVENIPSRPQAGIVKLTICYLGIVSGGSGALLGVLMMILN